MRIEIPNSPAASANEIHVDSGTDMAEHFRERRRRLGWRGQPLYWHLMPLPFTAATARPTGATPWCIDVIASSTTLVDASSQLVTLDGPGVDAGRLHTKHAAHLLRNSAVTVGGRVLIPHRRLRCAVAQPAHQLGQSRARLGG